MRTQKAPSERLSATLAELADAVTALEGSPALTREEASRVTSALVQMRRATANLELTLESMADRGE